MAKKILITGAINGLGRCLTEELSKDYDVVGLSRSSSKLGCLDIKNIEIDFSKPSCVALLGAVEKQKIKECDVLINNAGIYYDSSLEGYSKWKYDEVLQVNVNSVIELTEFFIKDRKFGRIININSVSGLRAQKGQEYYSASKHAIRGYFDSLAQTIGKNIKITNIYPAGINTSLWEKHPIPKEIREGFIDPKDLSELINSLVILPESIILKDLVVMPKNEWNC